VRRCKVLEGKTYPTHRTVPQKIAGCLETREPIFVKQGIEPLLGKMVAVEVPFHDWIGRGRWSKVRWKVKVEK